jgi:hypothetical protein
MLDSRCEAGPDARASAVALAASYAVLQPVWPDAEHVTAADLVSVLRQVMTAAAAGTADHVLGFTAAATSTSLSLFAN